MVQGILQMYLVLMAVVTVNQTLSPSGKNLISPEDKEEVLQRMKEREVFLQQHQLLLEKEIAELEAIQASLAWPLWELERKMQGHTGTVLCLVVPVLFVLWRQSRKGIPAGNPTGEDDDTEPENRGEDDDTEPENTGEDDDTEPENRGDDDDTEPENRGDGDDTEPEDTEEDEEPELQGKAWKGVAFLTKLSVLFRAISISMGRSVEYLRLFANRLYGLPSELAFKLRRLHKITVEVLRKAEIPPATDFIITFDESIYGQYYEYPA